MINNLRNLTKSRLVIATAFLFLIQIPEIPILKKNEIKIEYSKDENRYRITNAYALVNADLLTVLSVIADYENYPDFMPRVKSTKIYYQSRDSSRYRTDLNMPWPMNDVWYELSATRDTLKHEISWTMLNGNILDTKGFWRVHETDDGFIVLIYHSEVLLDSGFPEFVIRIFQKKTVKKMMKAIRSRAETSVRRNN